LSDKLHIVFPLLGVARSGGFRVISELASRLAQMGHRVTLLKADKQPVPYPVDERVGVVSVAAALKGPIPWRRLVAATTLYQAVPRDVSVVVSTYFLSAFLGWAAAKRRRALHVYFVQGYEPDFFQGRPYLINACRKALAALTYRLPCRLVAVSSWIARQLRKHTTSKVRVVSNGVDASAFVPSSSRRPSDGRLSVAALAWREPRKGLPDFLRAVEILMECRTNLAVRMASSDPSLRVNAQFKTELEFPSDDAELARWYRRSDLFVSASHLEGFGLPVLEAMACGVPVVTTDSGGVSDFAVDGYNCLMVPVAEPTALASAIARLLDDAGLRRRLAEGGLETARRLSWENTAAAFEQCLLAGG